MQAALSHAEAERPGASEEASRADFYALLAALFHHAPDAKLLGTIAIAPAMDGNDAALTQAWAQLVAASGVIDVEAVAEEYETLFVGMGKARLSIYAGWYMGAGASPPPRVRVIEALAELGLAYPPGNREPEDHFAGLFDTMRVLVAGGAGREPASLAEQKAFYEAHVKPGVGPFLEAVAGSPDSNYYRKVAALAKAFIGIENESFNWG